MPQVGIEVGAEADRVTITTTIDHEVLVAVCRRIAREESTGEFKPEDGYFFRAKFDKKTALKLASEIVETLQRLEP